MPNYGHLSLSCFLFRPRKRLEKRRKRSHTNVSNASVIRTSRIFQAPLQTPLPCFHQWVKLVLAQSSAKRPTFAFTGESGYPLGFRRKIAHPRLHAETGSVSDGALSLPSTRAARSRTSPGRVSERQTLPLLRLDPVCSRKRRGPAGLRRPTPPAERTVLAPISPRVQLCLRRPAFPLSAFIPGA